MTQWEKIARQAIRDWCVTQGLEVKSIHHVHPRAYVLGKAASHCLLIATPPMDATPTIQSAQALMGADGSQSAHLFDDALRAGDWCSVAYVVMSGRQEQVAVRVQVEGVRRG